MNHNIQYYYYKNSQKNTTTDFTIVLDIDYTLVATQSDVDDLKKLNILNDPKYFDLNERIYTCCDDQSKFWGIVRPYTKEFLIFCFTYFKYLYIWSAGTKEYVHLIVEFLFKNIDQKPHRIFTRDDIEYYEDDNNFAKPLEKIIQYQNISLNKIVIVDDTKSTAVYNEENIILIPPYKPKPTIDSMKRKTDECLLKLIDWFNQDKVKLSNNILKIKKDNIF